MAESVQIDALPQRERRKRREETEPEPVVPAVDPSVSRAALDQPSQTEFKVSGPSRNRIKQQQADSRARKAKTNSTMAHTRHANRHKIRIQFVLGTTSSEGKPVLADISTFESLMKTASDKTRTKAKRLFVYETATELTAENFQGLLRHDTKVVVSKGEQYGVPKAREETPDETGGAAATAVEEDEEEKEHVGEPSEDADDAGEAEPVAEAEPEANADEAETPPVTTTVTGARAVRAAPTAAVETKTDTTDVSIDGSIMEGGGQVLRNSVVYAALLGKRLEIKNVRGNRKTPGLQAQHTAGLTLVCDIAGISVKSKSAINPKMQGVELGSCEVVLDFRQDKSAKSKNTNANLCREYEADTHTAGATTLMLQACLPMCWFAPNLVKVKLMGGTNATLAPTIDYVTAVLLPTLARHCGIKISLDLQRRGWFPKGGGVVVLETLAKSGPQSGSLPPINITDRGTLTKIRCICTVAGVAPATQSESERKADKTATTLQYEAKRMLEKQFRSVPLVFEEPIAESQPDKARTASGCAILIIGESSTGCMVASSALSTHKDKAAACAKEAAYSFIKDWNLGGCVDQHMQDQLILYMCLARGTSRLKTGPLSLHTQTAIHFAQLLTGARFSVTPSAGFGSGPASEADALDETNMIECSGIDFR